MDWDTSFHPIIGGYSALAAISAFPFDDRKMLTSGFFIEISRKTE